VVDRDVALRKSEAIEHHASRLRAKLPIEAASLDADESVLNDVCFATGLADLDDFVAAMRRHAGLAVPRSV
jgi:hypothetical protein